MNVLDTLLKPLVQKSLIKSTIGDQRLTVILLWISRVNKYKIFLTSIWIWRSYKTSAVRSDSWQKRDRVPRTIFRTFCRWNRIFVVVFSLWTTHGHTTKRLTRHFKQWVAVGVCAREKAKPFFQSRKLLLRQFFEDDRWTDWKWRCEKNISLTPKWN